MIEIIKPEIIKPSPILKNKKGVNEPKQQEKNEKQPKKKKKDVNHADAMNSFIQKLAGAKTTSESPTRSFIENKKDKEEIKQSKLKSIDP